jgi:hypothetical protein
LIADIAVIARDRRDRKGKESAELGFSLESRGIGILLTACLHETLDGEWADPEFVSLTGSKPLFFNESRTRVFYHFGFTKGAHLPLTRGMYCPSRIMIDCLAC